MTDLAQPTAYTTFPLPRSAVDGETVHMTVRRATAEYFRLWSLPAPASWKHWPADGGREFRPRRMSQSRGTRYRIAYPAPDHPRGYQLARFCVQKGHTQQTLLALSDHLDAVGAPWLWLTNDDGAKLSHGLFHAKARP